MLINFTIRIPVFTENQMKFYIYFTLILIVVLIAWFFWWASTLEPQVSTDTDVKTTISQTIKQPLAVFNKNS